MATRTWDNGASTQAWGDANNWSANTAPVAGDAVVIPTGFGAITATLANTNLAFASLDIAGSTTLTIALSSSNIWTTNTSAWTAAIPIVWTFANTANNIGTIVGVCTLISPHGIQLNGTVTGPINLSGYPETHLFWRNAMANNQWEASGNWFTDLNGVTPAGVAPWIANDAAKDYTLHRSKPSIEAEDDINIGSGVTIGTYTTTGECDIDRVGIGYLTNNGTISGGTFFGVYIFNGGTISGGTQTGPDLNNSGTISGGTQLGASLTNSGGTISGGTQSGDYLDNGSGATISGGTQSGDYLDNSGTISGGMQSGEGLNNSGTISGGTQTGDYLSNYASGTISGGTQSGDYLGNDGATISGGTQTGDYLTNNGTISGGTQAGDNLTNNGTIWGGTFFGANFTPGGMIIAAVFVVSGNVALDDGSYASGRYTLASGTAPHGGVSGGGIYYLHAGADILGTGLL